MKNILPILFVLFFMVSCKQEESSKDKPLKIHVQKTDEQFKENALIIKKIGYYANIDSLLKEYRKVRMDSARAVAFISEFNKIAQNLQEEKIQNLIIIKAEQDSRRNEIQKEWENSEAGRIQKKHPGWSKRDCERLANNEIWIGMTIGMLREQRGSPDVANRSNYGDGERWQWCWTDHTTSCFYDHNDDGRIDAYN